MVAPPDNRDLSNKEKEHIQHRKKEKKKNDGQIKKSAKRVTDSTLPCCGAMVGKHDSVWRRLIQVVTALMELKS